MKLNNKGFAISTVIYGLAIMGILLVAIIMATMAATRSNSRQLAKSIEEELNRFNKSETFFAPIGNNISPQEYIIPATGWYKIELWGSSGTSGSNGAYTSGLIKLVEGDILYFYVGKEKTGAESDVRIVSGSYDDTYSLSSRIMVAAGGGSGSSAAGGTLYGYTDKMISIGGKIDSKHNGNFSLIPPGADNSETNGTLVGFNKNYTNSSVTYPESGEIIPRVKGSNGGGDGYYPSDNGSIGGTSYIAGYAGCKGLKSQGGKLNISNNPIANIYNLEYDSGSDDGGDEVYSNNAIKSYYFVDGIMLANSNSGKGKAKIERMVIQTQDNQKLNKKNDRLSGTIDAIIDCVDSTSPKPIKMSAISAGNEKVNSGVTEIGSGDGYEAGMKCGKVTISASELDEIAIWHENGAGTDPKNEVIKVHNTTKGWIKLRDKTAETPISETETVTGIRISAYQFDSMGEVPHSGTYYIMPVLSENKVASSAEKINDISNALAIEPINGYKRQRWAIESLKNEAGVYDGEYKLCEQARYNAFQILADENKLGNQVGADSIFNKYSKDDPQWWVIRPLGNGTYIIETRISAVEQEGDEDSTGYVTAQTNKDITENKDKLEIGKKNATTARFKLISVDYSSN